VQSFMLLSHCEQFWHYLAPGAYTIWLRSALGLYDSLRYDCDRAQPYFTYASNHFR